MVLSLVEIDSTKTNSVTIQNTPAVQGQFGAAVRDGRAFTAATTALRVHSEKYLNVVFENPSNSGKNALFVARKLGANRPSNEMPIAYGFVVTPSALTNATSLTPGNRLTGGAASSMLVSYNTTNAPAASTVQGFVPPEGFLPNGGFLLNVDDEADDVSRIVPPGNSFGFYIRGAGYEQSLDCARVVFTWYEEDV